MMNESKLVVYGAGGHGRVVVDTAMAAGWGIGLWIDDRPACPALWDIPIVASRDVSWGTMVSHAFVIAIGDNRKREEMFYRLCKFGLKPTLVIHPSAVISRFALIGSGTVVAADVVVNPAASIGENCILNTGCSVDHDCRVGSHAHLCPGVRLAGAVLVGAGAMIGVGATVMPRINLGEECVIGAGAVVTNDVPPKMVAYGNPARIVRSIE
jgi:sugar O-acyltransferase (sialic acid O-acetyltransferase NeuD family)